MNDQPTLFDGWCQRWHRRVDSWRHNDDGWIQPHRYQVVPLPEKTARAFTTTHHYSPTWPVSQLRYGLIEDGQHLVGTCVLGVPMQKAVLTRPFPLLEPYRQSMELVRLVLLDRVAANGESWFVSRVFRNAANLGVRGIVAFSDPMSRTVGDRLLMPGHVGVVYQALGAVYTGRGTARWLTILPDGSVLTARTLAKITGNEAGGRAAIARLVDLKAPPKPERMSGREWLPGALAAVGARKVWHPGNHRYAWSVGPRWSRRAFPVVLPALPYPKRFELGLAA